MITKDIAFHDRQMAPGYEPLYESDLDSRGGGFTESVSIYNGSEWLATTYLLRDGRYAVVTRAKNPENGRRVSFSGSRDSMRTVIAQITGGALCAAKPQPTVDCGYIVGSEYWPDENQHMPICCERQVLATDGTFCAEHEEVLAAEVRAMRDADARKARELGVGCTSVDANGDTCGACRGCAGSDYGR